MYVSGGGSGLRFPESAPAGRLWGFEAGSGARLFERTAFVTAIAATSTRVYVGGWGVQRRNYSWGTAANVYRIGDDFMDSQDRIEKYGQIARRVLPGIWTRPYGGGPDGRPSDFAAARRPTP